MHIFDWLLTETLKRAAQHNETCANGWKRFSNMQKSVFSFPYKNQLPIYIMTTVTSWIRYQQNTNLFHVWKRKEFSWTPTNEIAIQPFVKWKVYAKCSSSQVATNQSRNSFFYLLLDSALFFPIRIKGKCVISRPPVSMQCWCFVCERVYVLDSSYTRLHSNAEPVKMFRDQNEAIIKIENEKNVHTYQLNYDDDNLKTQQATAHKIGQ